MLKSLSELKDYMVLWSKIAKIIEVLWNSTSSGFDKKVPTLNH